MIGDLSGISRIFLITGHEEYPNAQGTGQELHLGISMVTDIVFDMVSGKELTKLANFLSQIDGTVLSGMANNYLTTGKVVSVSFCQR